MSAEVIMSYEDFEALKARHEQLRVALEWYANKKHWPMKFDNGEVARKVLAKEEK